MLTLKRYEGETIFIGPDVAVTVTHIGGRIVRLGIEAPPDVKIWREEIAPPGFREPAAPPK